jgi:hypothetical protein
MTPGYIVIESHSQHPGLVRVANLACRPDPDPGQHHTTRLHVVVAFDDSEAGMLHLHESLKRRLVDADAHLYRTTPERAIAGLDAVELRHRVLYLDCDFTPEQRRHIADMTEACLRRRRRVRQAFDAVGYIAVGLLLFNLFVLSRH